MNPTRRIIGLSCILILTRSSLHAASLTGSFSSIPRNSVINLSEVGTVDWVHWGLYTVTSLNRKSGVTARIGDFNVLVASGDTNAFANAYQYADNYNGYSWSDGTPEPRVTNTTTGVWCYGIPNIGTGFEFGVPADTTVRTLKVYVGAFAARGRFEATLSDGSAPPYVNTSLINQIGNGPSGAYTINYAAGSSGQTLRIRWTLLLGFRADANVTLQAAAMSVTGANNPPSVALTAPADSSTYAAPASITLNATASDFDGTISRVEFFADHQKLGQDTTSPYSFTWSSVPPGVYALKALAYDNGGEVSESKPVEVFVHGTGGSLVGGVTSPPSTLNLTTEGTADWAHWGLVTNTTYNHKADVSQQIGNFMKIGDNDMQRYDDNLTGYTWSDGTPTASIPTNSHTGVFIIGEDNGFALALPADTTNRTVKVYVGLYGAVGKFQAYLSDFSAQAYIDTSLDNVYENSYAVYTLTYAAASSSKTLRIRYRPKLLYDGEFGNVTLQAATLVGAGGGNIAPTVSITSPTNNATFTAPANISIQASASDSDGTITKVEFYNGSTKIGEALSSPYTFGWNNVPAGSYTLTARATDDDEATTTSAPVNITVTDAANSPPTVAITSPTNGTVFTAPASFTIQASASDSDGTINQIEFFVGTTSVGTDASSPYSASVSSLAAGSYNLSAIATDDDGAKATNSVSIIVNNPPSVSLTSPTNNSVFTAPANITLQATAGDTDGTIAKVEFYNGATKLGEDTSSPYSFAWNSVAAGSYTLTARAVDNYGAATISASVNISVVNPNSPPTVAITSPTNGTVFTAPASFTIQASASDSDGSINQVEFFVGTASVGTDASSPYSASVSSLAAGSYNLSAIATDDDGAKATNTVSTIVNNPPSVSLTSPTNNSVFTAPANITLQASAADTDGTISKVEFYNGTTKLAEDTSSPYSFAWNSVAAGSYTLTARAIDNYGATTTSAAVNISVVNPNSPPAVAITSPTNGTVFTAPASFTIQASASDSDGTVNQVEFFVGTASVGTDASSPYSASVSSLAAGSYNLSAIATDDDGAKATNSVSIIVNNPPSVSLTSPTNNSVFTAPANITLQATAGDTDGTISKVEFYNGTAKLGEDTSSPYSFGWNSVGAGSYSLTAKAIDNYGAIATSTIVTVIVSNSPPDSVTLLNARWESSAFRFSFASQTGRVYSVQSTLSLGTPNWQVLTNITAGATTVEVADPRAPAAARFYRVESQ